MTKPRFTRTLRLALGAGVLVTATALALTGCESASGGGGGNASDTLTIGPTDKVVGLDPAASADVGSGAVATQVYPYLFMGKPGTSDVEPDIAKSGEFISPTEYQVTLKPGLKFANGDPINAESVKFSFDRLFTINDPAGPQPIMTSFDSVEVKNDTTVVFHLKVPNDQTWPYVLSAGGAAIVDQKVFSPDAITPDKKILDKNAFGGPYTIASYTRNSLIEYKANPNYKGLLPKAKTKTVDVKYYSDQSNLKLDIGNGDIDVAFRSLSPTDVASLRKNKDLVVHEGPGGEIRYIVFNFDTMPYGAKTPQADPAKALAVRQAAADLIDRKVIAKQVYKDTYQPLFTNVPEGVNGSSPVLKKLYADGEGGPDKAKAAKTLKDAGVTGPVKLTIEYNADHYGASSADEYALIKNQLESSGLFTVTLQSTEWGTYAKQYATGDYPVFQLGGFADYPDPDDYLDVFFGKDSFLRNGYKDPVVYKLLASEKSDEDQDSRMATIEKLQERIGEKLPVIDLLQGKQIAVATKDVHGVDETLDGSFKFHYSLLSKG